MISSDKQLFTSDVRSTFDTVNVGSLHEVYSLACINQLCLSASLST